MLLEGKLKKVALLTATDICLKKADDSPKRCARNLIELGSCAYPDKITKPQKHDLYKQLITFIENGELQEAKSLFLSLYI